MGSGQDQLERLVDALAALPGIGRRTASRLAFHLLQSPVEEADALAKTISQTRHAIHPCPDCFNLASGEKCQICENPKRDRSKICVVEDARDILAIERTGAYQGLYHVLGGAISPVDNIGPQDLHIRPLLLRLQKEEVSEVILATNPSVEGEATALYLIDLLKPSGIPLTRPAQGLPMGGELKYTDDRTLARAFSDRTHISY